MFRSTFRWVQSNWRKLPVSHSHWKKKKKESWDIWYPYHCAIPPLCFSAIVSIRALIDVFWMSPPSLPGTKNAFLFFLLLCLGRPSLPSLLITLFWTLVALSESSQATSNRFCSQNITILAQYVALQKDIPSQKYRGILVWKLCRIITAIHGGVKKKSLPPLPLFFPLVCCTLHSGLGQYKYHWRLVLPD